MTDDMRLLLRILLEQELREAEPEMLRPKKKRTADLNCTPFVRQYGILSNKWGVLLCQKEYQTNDIRRNSRSW